MQFQSLVHGVVSMFEKSSQVFGSVASRRIRLPNLSAPYVRAEGASEPLKQAVEPVKQPSSFVN